MPNEDTNKEDAAETDKDEGKGEGDSSDSAAIELEPVKSKKGEPEDNLKRRAEWFQKRTGG